MEIEEISERIYHLKDAKALVSFATPSVTTKPGNSGKAMKINYGSGKGAEIWSWGSNNLLPQEREALVLDNNIVPELIATKRDITVGGGLFCFSERFEADANGKTKRVIEEVDRPPGAKEFFERVDENEYLMRSARNLLFHANTFTEYVRDLRNQIRSIKALHARHVRPEKQVAGRIGRWYVSGSWKDYRKEEYTPVAVENYKPDAFQKKFMLHCMDDILCDDYLGIPTWWGDRAWIECANAIPIFHINNLRNGYTIRWHIEIPRDYFLDNTAMQVNKDQRDAAKRREDEARKSFLNQLNEFLAGVEQAGRAIVTEYEINRQLGKEFPGIKITPLTVDLKDSALLALFDKSNDANISAQGIHPTLAAIQTQGKLSSGSEIRNAFNMYVAIKTPVKRAILLRPIQLVHKINGWDPAIKWGFRDIEMTTVDEKPSGIQPGTTA
jgi:hypothetical protein